MRALSAALLLATLATPAVAGDTKPTPAAPGTAEVTQRLEQIASAGAKVAFEVPRFAFTGNLSVDKPGSPRDVVRGLPTTALADPRYTAVVLVDADTAWVSAQLGEHYGCGECAKDPAEGWLRATALFERAPAGWQPIAWSITPPIPSGSQQEAMDDGIVPDKLARDTAGADDVASLFESTIGDAKKFSATFSDRKETVLFGSELPERYAGAKAKAQITAWNFRFSLRDGLRAGLSKSGSVAWLAANVDGTPKGAKAGVPFRVFALYERTDKGWKVVQMQFATSV